MTNAAIEIENASANGEPEDEEPFYSDLRAALGLVGKERNWFAVGALEGTPIAMLAGGEKKSKSWALHQLAVATVTGGSWLGEFPIRRPGRVLLLENEYGAVETARRIARICRGDGVDPQDVLGRIRHFGGEAQMLLDDEKQLGVGTSTGDDNLAEILDDLGEPGNEVALVIIDPFRNYIGGNENDARDVGIAFRAFRKIRKVAKCPIVIADHLNRAGLSAGSRSKKTHSDVFILGSDVDVPIYKSISRTLRRGDKLLSSFSISIEHEDDDNDLIAKSFVRAAFEGAASNERQPPHERVLAHLRAKGPANKKKIAEALGMSGTTIDAACTVLKAEKRAAWTKKGRTWLFEAKPATDDEILRAAGLVKSAHEAPPVEDEGPF